MHFLSYPMPQKSTEADLLNKFNKISKNVLKILLKYGIINAERFA